MGNFFTDDGRAVRIGTAPGRFPIAADDGAAAGRTSRRHGEDFFRAVAQFRQRADDFGDDFASLLDDDGIADADVFFFDVIFIVQRRPFDCRPGQVDRFEVGCRRQDARPAEADGNVQDFRPRLFGREFIGNGPAGILTVLPKRACWAKELTLTTMPSVA